MNPCVKSETARGPIVLLCTPAGKDASLASKVLDHAAIPSIICRNVQELSDSVYGSDIGLVILAEEALNPASIDRLREALEKQPPWSALPLIVLTGGGISTEASLNKLNRIRVLGNITLLERPLRTVTLIAAAQSALAARRRQFETRDYIQDLEDAKKQLAQANADLRQFAFAASHDLQEPLRMVKVFTQMLLQRHVNPQDPKAREVADYVSAGATRMELLLRDLLHYSRAAHEDREWAAASFNLESAVSDAISALKMEIDATAATIVFGALPVVHGHLGQLSLVFQNLFSNSMKYARHGVAPVIAVSADKPDGQLVVRVQDNGIGFDPKYAERVFDLFQRLGDADVPGTGLGLAICRRIVDRHGGRIWAESRPGKGAAFLFTLPGEQERE